jgi:hypothetical protein
MAGPEEFMYPHIFADPDEYPVWDDNDTLGERLAKITKLEQMGQRRARGIVLGSGSIAAAGVEAHSKSDELYAEGEQ